MWLARCSGEIRQRHPDLQKERQDGSWKNKERRADRERKQEKTEKRDRRISIDKLIFEGEQSEC